MKMSPCNDNTLHRRINPLVDVPLLEHLEAVREGRVLD